MPFPNFDYALVTRQSIEKAIELANHYELHQKPNEPANISVLWDYFKMYILDMPVSTWGFTMDMGEMGITIAINNLLTPTQQLFTFAHELGHVLMHHTDRLNTCLTDEQEMQAKILFEVEATTVAAYLLIPSQAVANGGKFDVSEVVRHYLVPPELAIIRWKLYCSTGL